MLNYALIVGCVLVVACGQLLFKTVGTRMGEDGFAALLVDHKAAALFLLALSAYGISTLGWVYALRAVPLSTAYLFMSASFILVPLMSWMVFDEPMSARLVIASAMIIGGILVAASAPA